MRATRHPVLATAALNRATLARQLLLDPAALDPVAALERIGGAQAQEPASPYIALWTRLADFDAARLDDAFRDRRVVKATLMRATVHAVSAADYRHLLPAILPMLRAGVRRGGRATAVGDIDALAAATLEHAATPRGLAEIRNLLAGLVPPGVDPDDALWRVRRHAPLVHVPADVPWSFGRRPLLTGGPGWLDDQGFADPGPAVERLVERHLAAFGPASVADVAAWSGLPIAALRPAVAGLDARDALVRFSGEGGRELLDLPDAPRPAADVPAPPRLLPMWDSLLLAHADRTRVVSDVDRARVIARNGDTLPSFLVDGRVAGLWWLEAGGAPDRTARLVLEPFRALPRATRVELERLGERLAAFVSPHEPTVCRRYRRSRARRDPGQTPGPAPSAKSRAKPG